MCIKQTENVYTNPEIKLISINQPQFDIDLLPSKYLPVTLLQRLFFLNIV
jgi:hypothetical protein